MGSKSVIYFCIFIGSAIGGFIPSLWDEGLFSVSSIILSGIGALAGIWAGYKINQMIDG